MISHLVKLRKLSYCSCFYLVFHISTSLASTATIEVAIDGQYFPSDSELTDANHTINNNFFLGLEHSTTFFDDKVTLNLDGYINYNRRDKNQTLIDFNELTLNYFSDSYAISVGMLTEFWGVTESLHLVDVLNQTNVAANIDEENKLGQPMVKLDLYSDLGRFQLYWMPVFRERIFPSEEGRLRTELFVDEDYAQYESSDDDQHHDFAARYSHTFDRVDIGLAYFNGTARTPLLKPILNNNDETILSPFYWQNEQISVDAQLTLESLLLKLEAINSKSEVLGTYQAVVTGFEYTQVGIFNSAMDLGYIGEYLYDERDELATTPFADDFFLGLRLAANDVSQSTFLLGAYIDNETHHNAWRFELEKRIKDGLTLSIEGQYFSSQDNDELLFNFRNDHYLTIGLQAFF